MASTSAAHGRRRTRRAVSTRSKAVSKKRRACRDGPHRRARRAHRRLSVLRAQRARRRTNRMAIAVGTVDYFLFDMPPNIGSQIETLRNLTGREIANGFLTKDDTVLDNLVSRISQSLDDVVNNADPKNRQWKRLEEALKKDGERAARFKQSLTFALSGILTDYAKSSWTPEFLYRTPSYDSFVIINVQNAGERQAVGVELQLPYDGIAVVEEPGEKARVRTFDKKIALGTILPKGERKLRIWTSSRVTSYSFDLEKWRIAYGDGVGKLTWVRKQ